MFSVRCSYPHVTRNDHPPSCLAFAVLAFFRATGSAPFVASSLRRFVPSSDHIAMILWIAWAVFASGATDGGTSLIMGPS